MGRPSRRSRGTATIQDVALKAGVSAMTVSRVVNGVKNVRESTREAVLQAVQLLNYSPNSAARSLAAGEATKIGLLYANPSPAYLSQFLVGALDGARRAGCHLVIESCDLGSDDHVETARRFAETEVEGVILPPPLAQSRALRAEIEETNTRVVSVEGLRPESSQLNVRIDDLAAGSAMTRHLIELGHRHIGFIKGPADQQVSGDRYRGFCAALEEAGLDPKSAPFADGNFTYRSGLAAAEQLLSLSPRPTAIFASNDDMAAAAVNVAHRQGLSVPGDLSVAGFDDTGPATTIWPELTTIRQPVAAMAETALNLLLAALRAERAGVEIATYEHVLGHQLIVRKSSGPPHA
jgi:LacI family transcriptional regulator